MNQSTALDLRRQAEEKPRILLVDDDASFLRLLALHLGSIGYEVSTATGGAEALAALDIELPQLVITDLRMEGIDGLGVLDSIVRNHPGLPVILLTAHGSIPDAVAATRNGAYGFLTKPIDKTELRSQVSRALSFSAATSTSNIWCPEIITRSALMNRVLSTAQAIAASDGSVLITGESGTGKELFARAMHRASARSGEFVAINCAAIPENLLESELFGHTKGSFSGAIADGQGLVRQANNGTLFLDEIGDMPVALQVKLLRVLQDRRVRAVGATTDDEVDVRVISATNHDLSAAITDGTFREDLYYRLNVLGLQIPSLGERREDIPMLVNHFLAGSGKDEASTGNTMAPDALEMLVAADWPGNVRQLENVVHRCAILSPTGVINVATVEEALGDASDGLVPLAEAREAFTRNYLTRLLTMTDGNVTRAAKLAQRNRTEFYKLLSRHGVEPARFKRRRAQTTS